MGGTGGAPFFGGVIGALGIGGGLKYPGSPGFASGFGGAREGIGGLCGSGGVGGGAFNGALGGDDKRFAGWGFEIPWISWLQLPRQHFCRYWMRNHWWSNSMSGRYGKR